MQDLRYRDTWTDPALTRQRLWNFRLTLLVTCLIIITLPITIVQWPSYHKFIWYLPSVLVVFVHHLLSVVQIPDKPAFLNLIADLIHATFLFAELGCLAFTTCKLKPLITRWDAPVIVIAFSSLYILQVLLGFTCINTCYYTIFVAPSLFQDTPRQQPMRTGTSTSLVIQGPEIEERPRDDGDYPNTDIAAPQEQNPTLRFRGRAKDILISRELWETRFEGEAKVIKTFRGIIALIMAIGLAMYGIQSIFIGPQQEVAATPARIIFADDFVLRTTTPLPTWNVVAYVDVQIQGDEARLRSAVNVTVLWDKNFVPDGPPCISPGSDGTHRYFPKDKTSNPYYFSAIAIKVVCPASIPANLKGTGLDHIPAAYFSPELLVTLNFTELGLDVTDSFGQMSKSTVHIVVGLTDHMEDITSASSAVALFPGLKLVGSLSRNVRKRFDTPRASVLGLFSSTHEFYNSYFTALMADPSPQVPSGPDIATLRIFDLYELTQWNSLEDDHGQTVIDGFSALGGLSSFFNTVFSAIFGTTLLLVVLGKKSISLFGFAQYLNRRQIIQAVQQKYPRLGQEKSKGGLLAWIQDHLIDLGPLEHVHPVQGNKEV